MLERLTDHPESVSDPGHGQHLGPARGYDGERLIAEHYDWEIARESWHDFHIDPHSYAEAKTVVREYADGSPGRVQLNFWEVSNLMSGSYAHSNRYIILVIDPADTRVLRWFSLRPTTIQGQIYGGRDRIVASPTWRELAELDTFDEHIRDP
jgi:hypothetical protein